MTRRGNLVKVMSAAAVIALIVIGASGCRREFPVISEEQIPRAVLDLADGSVPKGMSPDDLGFVWRVCAPKDGRQIVAFTFNMAGDKKKPTLFIASFPLDESGEVAPFDGHHVIEDFSETVATQGGIASGTAQAKDGSAYMKLDAGGICLNPRLAKVVGTTSEGRTAETTPTNGFWFLFINDTRSVETWYRIVGLDSSGKVIVDFTPGILAS
jgi:hypothetical protein